MTPFEITGIGIMASYYLMKYLRGREKKLGECLWDYLAERKERKAERDREPNFASPWQKSQRMNDEKIHGEPNQFTQKYWDQRRGS